MLVKTMETEFGTACAISVVNPIQQELSPMKNFLTSEDAATTAEYAVLLALIAGALLFSILAVGGEANVFWGRSSTELNAAFN